MRRNEFVNKRILEVIDKFPKEAISDEEFNTLALDIFKWQKSVNPIYKKLVQLQNAKPCYWDEIPAVPVSLYKTCRLSNFSKKRPEHIFKTSGTTEGARRGAHFFYSSDIYDKTIYSLFGHYLIPDCQKIAVASLIPLFKDARVSSLAYMAKMVSKYFSNGRFFAAVKKNSFDFKGLECFLKKCQRVREPVLINATSLALASFLEYLKKRSTVIALPLGSRIMETGGFKGKSRNTNRQDIDKLAERYLKIPARSIVNEYGMTELTSQFYDRSISDEYRFGPGVKGIPPWTRILIINPQTGRPSAQGETGLIRIFDLANVSSSCFIQTEDEGYLCYGGFKVIGRAREAGLRGCSLMFDEMGVP